MREYTVIPSDMMPVADNYHTPCSHPGRLEKLVYPTWESKTYLLHSKPLQKTAWIYLPYGYDENRQYDVVYMSHGGWSDETTLLGTDKDPHELKHFIDHAIEDGLMAPVIVVALTYNNMNDHDSWDYQLAIELTRNYHHELINDLIPAVEAKYSCFHSRDHRCFAGFSMGSVNTWRTFQYCLKQFRYFMPMSGNLTGSGEFMADIVRKSGFKWNDFFILSSSGSRDFARDAFVQQIQNMSMQRDIFRYGNNEENSNLFYREWENGEHGPEACDLYTWNNLLWISQRMKARQ